MSDTLQLVVVGLIVLAAVLYLVRAAWKMVTGRSANGCGSGCGKCATQAPEPKRDGRFPLPQA